MENTFNFLEIISGTSNRLDPLYLEASNDIDSGNDRGFGHIKNFIGNIEDIANKNSVKDDRIARTKGNIKNFSGYKSIEESLNFLSKNLGSVENVKDAKKLYDLIERYQPLYSQGYDKKVRLIELEYESAVYCLTAVLSILLATTFDIVANGSEIKIVKKANPPKCLYIDTMKELVKQLGNDKHKSYLEELLKAVDSTVSNKAAKPHTESVMLFKEATIADSLDLISAMWRGVKKVGNAGKNLLVGIKNSFFGIVPLIRGIMYLRDKKKADAVVSLEEQIANIQRNIEQLQNMKTTDPKKKAIVIKRQKAMIEKYRQKAEKIRAQLLEGEKDAKTAMTQDNKTIKTAKTTSTTNTSDDEFTLESYHEDYSLNIENLKDVSTSIGTDYDTITEAENNLGVRFNQDFINILYEYGNVKSEDFELIGLGNDVTVVEATQQEWDLNNKVPHNMYVIENTRIDGVVIWQDTDGAIYESTPNKAPKFINSSLASYLSTKEYEVNDYEY